MLFIFTSSDAECATASLDPCLGPLWTPTQGREVHRGAQTGGSRAVALVVGDDDERGAEAVRDVGGRQQRMGCGGVYSLGGSPPSLAW